MPALPYMLAFAVGFVLMMVLDVVMGLLLFRLSEAHVISTERSELRNLNRCLDYARHDSMELFLFLMHIDRYALGEVISPSLRTESSLVTDWEFEPDGLKVFINCMGGGVCWQMSPSLTIMGLTSL